MLALVAATVVAKQPFSIEALFFEGCGCKGVCATELTGIDQGCRGVAAMKFYKAQYAGRDFSGTSAAWAWGPSGEWVRIYVQTPAVKKTALVSFMTAALADWGTLVSVKDAVIEIQGAKGSYQASVNGGETMALSVRPVLGANKTTGVAISNLPGPLHSMVMQGRTTSASFKDGLDPFTLEESNAFYNARTVMKGKL